MNTYFGKLHVFFSWISHISLGDAKMLGQTYTLFQMCISSDFIFYLSHILLCLIASFLLLSQTKKTMVYACLLLWQIYVISEVSTWDRVYAKQMECYTIWDLIIFKGPKAGAKGWNGKIQYKFW